MIPSDRSLLTGKRVTVGVDSKGKVFTIHDHLDEPSEMTLPEHWTGTSSFETKVSVSMISENHRGNLKVPMTCCKSATNTYRKVVQPIINTIKGLRKHKRRNIPKLHTLIEVCCGADSKFGSPDLMPPNVEVVRITSSNDFSTSLSAQGLQKAIKALRSAVGKRDRRHVTV